MDLDRSLLKEFAKVVNDVGDKPAPKQYVYGTITTGEGNAKYVKLDGSDMLTPISEVVVAEAGDRVLVSVENHQATVIGNITFPPSARKEDQAIESANGALNQSNQAMEKAKDAQTKASSAITDSSIASALANEAKSESAKAQENANKAIQNAGEAKQLAQTSSDKSDETQQLVNQVKDSVTAANKDISALKTEVKTANDNIASANTKLDTQAGEIATIKETYSTKVETEGTKAELTTEISKQVGALQTTVEKNFATKTENIALEKKLQTQITQNANLISSTVTKVEKLESDTTEQQKNIDKALQDAQAANTAAGIAKSDAEKAKTAADTAQKAADDATAKAESATTAANLAEQKVTAADKQLQSAKTDLKEAQENLKNVTSRVDATKQEITDAKQKVDTANANVTKALTDVAEANAAASKANEVASKAQGEATAANKAASDAQTKAADAQKVATNAQQAADKAQSDLAKLTNRVTTAETKITQTNEAITAQATKITEVSNKIDGIQNDITNNYYSKEQTDAQIKVSADKISQTVTETNKVVTNANKNATDALNKANSLTDRANSGEFNGRGIKSTSVEYQASISGTTVPTGTWSPTIPSVAAGSYLWTKTTTNYTSGSPTIGYSVARMGAKGDKGATGPQGIQGPQGVQGVKGNDGKTYYTWIKYADSPTSGMSDSPTGKLYLGVAYNKSTATESTNYSDYSWSLIKGDKGDKGATGATGSQGPQGAQGVKGDKGATGPRGPTGATGNGIKSIVYTYARTTSQTAPDASTITSTTMPTLDATNKYLWQKEVITYTNNQRQETVLLLAVYGDRGATGATGPQGVKGDTGPKGPQGATGPQGVKGNDGKGIKSTSVTYQIWPNGTSTPTGTWSSTPPKTTADKPYLWTRTVITYTDNTQSTSYSVGSTPEGIQIGGRNLLKNSHSVEQTYSYPSSNYVDQCGWVTSIPLNGDTYTLSFWAKSTVAGDTIRVHFYNPSNITHCVGSQGQVSDNNDGQCDFTLSTVLTKYWVTYTIPKGGNSARSVIIPRMFSDFGKGTVSVKWEKLEEGNKATDWTPAPEDVDNAINTERTMRQSAIETKANEITSKVSETYVSNSALEHYQKDVESRFVQTNKDFTWALGQSITAAKNSLMGSIDSVNGRIDGVEKTTSKVSTYMKFDDDGLTIGKQDDKDTKSLKTRFTNQEWAILKDTEKVTYINDKTMYITDGQFTESLKVGNFGFVPRENGSLDFKKIR